MSTAENALDAAAAQVLAFLQQAGAPKVHELPVAQARAVFEAMAPQLDMAEEPMAGRGRSASISLARAWRMHPSFCSFMAAAG